MHKTELSGCQRALVEMMQRINFGRVEGLAVKDGNPVLNPPPRVVRQVRFCRQNGPRPETAKADFALKAEVHDLFAHMEAMGDGVIECLEVQHGLPFRMTVEEDAA